MTIKGIAPGVYDLDGVTIFGKNEADARAAYARLIAHEHRATETPGAEWYSCPNCGKSVDVGDDCPICPPVTFDDIYNNPGLVSDVTHAQVYAECLEQLESIPFDGSPAGYADEYGLEAVA